MAPRGRGTNTRTAQTTSPLGVIVTGLLLFLSSLAASDAELPATPVLDAPATTSAPGTPSAAPATPASPTAAGPTAATPSTPPAMTPPSPVQPQPVSTTGKPVREKVAVMDVEVRGMEAADGSNLSRAIGETASAAIGFLGYPVVSRADVESLISYDQMKTALACDDKVSCLSEIGGALGSDLLVTGSLVRLGDGYTLTLTLFDMKGMAVRNRFQGNAGSDAVILDTTRRAISVLFGQEIDLSGTGTLFVKTEPAGARIFVDDRAAGISPLTIDPIAAGEHLVTAEKDGMRGRARVMIEREAVERIQIRLGMASPVKVKIFSVPADVEVSLDGKEIGVTPVLVADVPAGPHQLRFVAAGHRISDMSVVLDEQEFDRNGGVPLKVEARLQSAQPLREKCKTTRDIGMCRAAAPEAIVTGETTVAHELLLPLCAAGDHAVCTYLALAELDAGEIAHAKSRTTDACLKGWADACELRTAVWLGDVARLSRARVRVMQESAHFLRVPATFSTRVPASESGVVCRERALCGALCRNDDALACVEDARLALAASKAATSDVVRREEWRAALVSLKKSCAAEPNKPCTDFYEEKRNFNDRYGEHTNWFGVLVAPPLAGVGIGVLGMVSLLGAANLEPTLLGSDVKPGDAPQLAYYATAGALGAGIGGATGALLGGGVQPALAAGVAGAIVQAVGAGLSVANSSATATKASEARDACATTECPKADKLYDESRAALVWGMGITTASAVGVSLVLTPFFIPKLGENFE